MSKAKPKSPKQYTVKTLLWLSGEKRYANPGEIVELDHLPAEGIKRLVDMGAIELCTQVYTQETQPEVDNG